MKRLFEHVVPDGYESIMPGKHGRGSRHGGWSRKLRATSSTENTKEGMIWK